MTPPIEASKNLFTWERMKATTSYLLTNLLGAFVLLCPFYFLGYLSGEFLILMGPISICSNILFRGDSNDLDKPKSFDFFRLIKGVAWSLIAVIIVKCQLFILLKIESILWRSFLLILFLVFDFVAFHIFFQNSKMRGFYDDE